MNPNLYSAARGGKLEEVRRLIGSGANVNWVEPTNGAAPLYTASQEGHKDVAFRRMLDREKSLASRRWIMGPDANSNGSLRPKRMRFPRNPVQRVWQNRRRPLSQKRTPIFVQRCQSVFRK